MLWRFLPRILVAIPATSAGSDRRLTAIGITSLAHLLRSLFEEVDAAISPLARPRIIRMLSHRNVRPTPAAPCRKNSSTVESMVTPKVFLRNPVPKRWHSTFPAISHPASLMYQESQT
jgi:hypothetical protein